MINSPRQTVLIVDDLLINQLFAAAVLEAECAVICASDETEALRQAAENLPDLILLDAQMAGVGGFEVCRQLKNNPLTASIPVIFLTALSSHGDEALGLEIGAIDYITKPFSAPVLRARVRNHLELVRQRELLERIAQCDGLTGIANRRAFDSFLEHHWQLQLTQQRPLALLMIDVDHFKLYNDSLGHLHGDHCLRRIAQALDGLRTRNNHMVARFGGEEFACVLPDIETAGALHVAERMRDVVKALHIRHPASSTCEWVTLSIGVAVMVPHAERSVNALIKRADTALYSAKHKGRNRVEIHQDSRTN
jgi:diguanylate cyclase (GGDEF)-like protein